MKLVMFKFMSASPRRFFGTLLHSPLTLRLSIRISARLMFLNICTFLLSNVSCSSDL